MCWGVGVMALGLVGVWVWVEGILPRRGWDVVRDVARVFFLIMCL